MSEREEMGDAIRRQLGPGLSELGRLMGLTRPGPAIVDHDAPGPDFIPTEPLVTDYLQRHPALHDEMIDGEPPVPEGMAGLGRRPVVTAILPGLLEWMEKAHMGRTQMDGHVYAAVLTVLPWWLPGRRRWARLIAYEAAFRT